MRTHRHRRRRVLLVAVALFLILPVLFIELERGARPATDVPASIDPGPFKVYVADWDYHTSIIVPQPVGWRLGPAGREDAPYVEFAWGNRWYYKDGAHGILSTLSAALWPSPSVTYLEGWAAPPDPRRWGGRTLLVREVSGQVLRALLVELEASFDRSTAYPPAPGYSGTFYRGYAHYLWWFACNRWTVDRLAAAGLARGGRGVLFSRQVAGRLRGFRVAR